MFFNLSSVKEKLKGSLYIGRGEEKDQEEEEEEEVQEEEEEIDEEEEEEQEEEEEIDEEEENAFGMFSRLYESEALRRRLIWRQ